MDGGRRRCNPVIYTPRYPQWYENDIGKRLYLLSLAGVPGIQIMEKGHAVVAGVEITCTHLSAHFSPLNLGVFHLQS